MKNPICLHSAYGIAAGRDPDIVKRNREWQCLHNSIAVNHILASEGVNVPAARVRWGQEPLRPS